METSNIPEIPAPIPATRSTNVFAPVARTVMMPEIIPKSKTMKTLIPISAQTSTIRYGIINTKL